MIKLYNDDFRNVLPQILLENKGREIIFVSDPPFNIGYKYKGYKDSLSDDEYDKMMIEAFSTKEHASVVIHYPEYLHKLSLLLGEAPKRVISWVYNSNTAKQHRDICFYGVKPDFSQCVQPYKNMGDKRVQKLLREGHEGSSLYDWWNINQVKNVNAEKTAHPCQMPLEVMKNIIAILPKSALIIDPFLGSGTTGVACKLRERDFIGVELIKEYYEIAEERMRIAEPTTETKATQMSLF